MNDNYYCPNCDIFWDADEVREAGWQNDPRCSFCGQPVDHMGDSDPAAYDTLEEMKGR